MDAGAGLPMEPDCPASLVAAVETLADDAAAAHRRSRAGRDYVAEHFDRDALAASFQRLLCQVAGIPSTERTDDLLHVDGHCLLCRT